MAFADNLKKIPPVTGIEKLELLRRDGGIEAIIENRPGQAGSLAVYHYLATKYGLLHAEAALEGLELYAEHATDARINPGKHPNIDRLLRIREENLRFTARVTRKT
ncbi:MAG TPA: DUF2322 family protein [Burkholderiales bacterium]|nr:DUF2322 family protein [Burkholderiales bacterium]